MSLVAAVAVILTAGAIAGAPGIAVGSAISVLAIAWRHDTQLGTCFPLAVLFLLVICVLLLLFFLAVSVAGR